MYVPIIPNTTIINKTIIYSDTVLSLKDKGKNIKITTINNINEYEIENCLKTIFNSNANVIFNTIQYSKKNKALYLYTNKNISTKEWDNRELKTNNPINNQKNILIELMNIINKDTNKNPNYISIYDISYLLKKYEINYNNLIKEYTSKINEKINNITDDRLIIYSFNYNKNELKTGFLHSNKEIIFKNDNNDLYIYKSDSYYSNELLQYAGNELLELYDKLLEFEHFKNDYKIINIEDSNLKLDISQYAIKIYMPNFSLYSYNNEEQYKCICNSAKISSTINNNEELILRNIFVKIEECPEYLKKELYEIRNKQLKKKAKSKILSFLPWKR